MLDRLAAKFCKQHRRDPQGQSGGFMVYVAAAFQRVNVQISDLANFDAATEKARYLFGADCESR